MAAGRSVASAERAPVPHFQSKPGSKASSASPTSPGRSFLRPGIVGLFVGAIALAARQAAVQAEPVLAPLATVVASFSAALIAEIGFSCSSRAAPASTGSRSSSPARP